MQSFFNTLRQFGIGRLTAILGAVGGAVAVLAAVFLHIGAQPQSLLYSNLDLKEASEITTNLSQAGIKYSAQGDGSVIMVNRDDVARARMMLASKGLPTSGSVGYEIFDNAPALGQTELVQNIEQQRALEGELARTIRTLRGISSARVHLVMPKRELFQETADAPTASVVLGLSGSDLTPDQVSAIRNLIAGAVPDLKADNVTVVDDRNHLLAAPGQDDELAGINSAHKNDVEEGYRKRILDIVEGVVGPGAARVTVTADLDPTSTTKEQVQYDPDGQVVRSTSTNSNSDTSANPDNGGQTTASANIPNTQQAPTIATTSANSSKQDSEVTNYEISTTKTTTVTGPGEVRKLSVAVVVDGVTTPAKDGKGPDGYAPRSAEDMQKIHDLVAAAVGIDATRGDQLQVLNVRFSHSALDNAGVGVKSNLFDFDKNDIMRAAEIGVLLVVALLTIFLVLRPLLKFINGGTANYLAAANSGGALAGPGGLQLSAAGGVPMPSITNQVADNIAATGLVPTQEQEQRIDIARIEGQVKASSVKKVSEFVDRHPEESVSILRAWLHDS